MVETGIQPPFAQAAAQQRMVGDALLNASIRRQTEKEWIMTVHEQTIAKIRQLPEPLVQEVSDFIDFLLVKHDNRRWRLWTHLSESLSLSESDFSDYLVNLETYEDRLARGEIQW